jgi:hypothetical protein
VSKNDIPTETVTRFRDLILLKHRSDQELVSKNDIPTETATRFRDLILLKHRSDHGAGVKE